MAGRGGRRSVMTSTVVGIAGVGSRSARLEVSFKKLESSQSVYETIVGNPAGTGGSAVRRSSDPVGRGVAVR